MKIYEKIALFSLFICLTFICHKKYLFDYPLYTHAWSQSDRYALANGFVDNDLNLFQPQTSVYNHPIPNNWNTADATRITSVDFPIHDFVPAIFMKIFGNTSPFFFRFYILLYGFLGIYFLYKLAKTFNNSFILSFFIAVFAATTPVFVYYNSGFLPTIPSFSNAIIGIYFYFNYLNKKELKSFYWSLFFMTFAALARTTFIIPLFAVFSLEFLLLFRKGSEIKKKILPSLVAISSVMFYYFYNNYLREIHGSLFLNKLLPAKNWTIFKIILKDVYDNWLFHYFSMTHYLAFISLIIIAIGTILYKKISFSSIIKKVSLYLLILFIGNFIFFLLMVQQYSNHDYYFLDTFYLPVILLLVLTSNFILISSTRSNVFYAVIFSFCTTMILVNAVKMQESKRETGSWDAIANSVSNFKNSERFLLKNGIHKSDKVIVLNGYTPNLPFVLMNRTGYCTMFPTKKVYKNALKFPAKYVIFQNEYFLSDVYSVFPSIIKHLRFIASNGKITICTKSDKEINQTLDQFLMLDSKQTVVEKEIDFENTFLINTLTTQAFSTDPSNKVGIISDQDEFGILYQTINDTLFWNHKRILKLQGNFEKLGTTELELVVSFTENDSLIYYSNYNLKSSSSKNKASKFTFLFDLPLSKSNKNEVKMYFWNPRKGVFKLDDLHLKIY